MKLHLPKMLLVAVMAALAVPTMGATLTNVAPEGADYKYWEVGGGIATVHPKDGMVEYDGDLTLNSGDKLGHFDSSLNLVQYDNGDGCFVVKVTQRDKDTNTVVNTYNEYTGNNEFSNMLTVNGTLTNNGTAQVAIGGQYKVQTRTDKVDAAGNVTTKGTASSYTDHYSALKADKVVVNGTGTGTHLQATAAIIDDLEVNGGNVSFHKDQYSGNSSFSALTASDPTSFKAVKIANSLTIKNDGKVDMGRTHGKHNNTTTSHIVNVFGSSNQAITITQDSGSFQAIGYSYAKSGMTINQSGGTMTFRDYLQFTGTDTNTITQSGNASLSIGQIKGSGAVTFDINQSGSGSITLNYGAAIDAKGVININQSGSGTITLGGGNKQHTYSGVKNYPTTYAATGKYNISQTGSGTLHLYSRDGVTPAISAVSTEIGAQSQLKLDAGTSLTTTTLDVSSGSTIDNNGVITVGTGTAGTEAGSLTVTSGGTLNATLDGSKAALNIGAAASDTNTVTSWTMGSGSTFGVGFTAAYFDTLTTTEVDGVKQITFTDVLVATVADGSSVNTDSFSCNFVAGDIAGLASEHFTLKDVKWGNDATGNVVLSGVLEYDPWVKLTQGGEEDRSFADITEYKTGLAISENDITLSGNNSHTLGTKIDGVEVTIAHENALGDGPVSTEGEAALVAEEGVKAVLPDEIDNGGSLTMQGAFKADFTPDVVDVEAAYITTEGVEDADGNGFYREACTGLLIVNNDATTGSLTVVPGTTVEIDGTTYELADSGLAGVDEPIYDVYYIRTEGEGSKVNSSDILDAAGISDVTVEMTEATGELTADSAIDVVATAGTLKTTADADVTGSLTDTTIEAAGGIISATIAGDSSVTVTGSDTTTISGSNTYSGGTTIDGGVLEIGAADSLGTEAIELTNGGTLDLKGMAVTNDIKVIGCTLKGTGAFAGDLDVSGDLTLTDPTTAHALLLSGAGKVSGISLTVDEVEVKTDADATIDGDLTLNEDGIIALYNGKALSVSGNITLQGVTTLKLEGDYQAGDTLVSADEELSADEVVLDYVDEDVMLEQVGNSLVLTLKYKREIADGLGFANWGIATASRAFTDAVHGQRNNTACFADGRGTAWFSILAGHNDLYGTDVNVTGAVLGADMHISPKHLLGVAFGYVEGDVTPTGLGKVDQEGYYAAVYGEHVLKQISVNDSWTMDWTLAYGATDSSFNGMDWDQDSVQINARVSRNHMVSDRLGVNGFVGLEYFATDSATVNGVETGSIQNLRGELGVGASYVLWGMPAITDAKTGSILSAGCERLVLNGEITYFNDMVRHDPVIRMNGVSGGICNPGRSGVEIELGATYRFNSRWSASVNYSYSAMEDSNEHRVNVGASWSF